MLVLLPVLIPKLFLELGIRAINYLLLFFIFFILFFLCSVLNTQSKNHTEIKVVAILVCSPLKLCVNCARQETCVPGCIFVREFPTTNSNSIDHMFNYVVLKQPTNFVLKQNCPRNIGKFARNCL